MASFEELFRFPCSAATFFSEFRSLSQEQKYILVYYYLYSSEVFFIMQISSTYIDRNYSILCSLNKLNILVVQGKQIIFFLHKILSFVLPFLKISCSFSFILDWIFSAVFGSFSLCRSTDSFNLEWIYPQIKKLYSKDFKDVFSL